MPRKPNTSNDRYHDAFPTALRDLMRSKKVNQETLANELGFSRQTISQYCSGASDPGLNTLVKIAKYFDVSTDYLLGVSDVKSTDTDLKAVCEYTGLSEDAVNMILSCKGDVFGAFIDIFLCADSFNEFLRCLVGVSATCADMQAKTKSLTENHTLHIYGTEIEVNNTETKTDVLGDVYMALQAGYYELLDSSRTIIDEVCHYKEAKEHISAVYNQYSKLLDRERGLFLRDYVEGADGFDKETDN